MYGVNLTLTLDNVSITGSDNAGGNGGSAIGFSSGSHTIVINGTVNVRGGAGNAVGGHAAYGYSDTQLTIVCNGTGLLAGGAGNASYGHGFLDAESLMVSGDGGLTCHGRDRRDDELKRKHHYINQSYGGSTHYIYSRKGFEGNISNLLTIPIPAYAAQNPYGLIFNVTDGKFYEDIDDNGVLGPVPTIRMGGFASLIFRQSRRPRRRVP